MDPSKMKAVYTIIENEKLEKPFFCRIGTAFVNRDDSLNVFLDALPVNGRLHVREIERRVEAGSDEEANSAVHGANGKSHARKAKEVA